jgi:hypothetical protein
MATSALATGVGAFINLESTGPWGALRANYTK